MKKATPEEALTIVRWLVGNLKTGAGEKTVIGGLSRGLIMFLKPELPIELIEIDSQKIEGLINEAYNIAPNYEEIIRQILANPENMYQIKEHCSLKVGIPIKPMLSKSIKGFDEILERF